MSTITSATSRYSGSRSTRIRRSAPSGSSSSRGRWSPVVARAASTSTSATSHTTRASAAVRAARFSSPQHDAAGRGDHGRLRRVERVAQRRGLQHPVRRLAVGVPDLAHRPTGGSPRRPRPSQRARAPAGRQATARRSSSRTPSGRRGRRGEACRRHHRTSAPNAAIARSVVTRWAPSTIAWAASIRSNGSP